MKIPILFLPLVFLGDTKFVEVKGREAFLRGVDFDQVMVDGRGWLRPGYASRVGEIGDESAAWCGLESGKTTWVGTTTGKIYRVENAASTLEFETGELLVTAIVEQQGELYASTIPSGRIFKRSATGEWKEHLKVESRYVWDLVSTGRGIVAVCGDPAALVRVSGEIVYRAKADHILCALPDGDGFWIGTANPGHLIHTSTGRVHHDFQGGEVRTMVQSGGSLWVAANHSKVSPADLVKASLNPTPADPIPAAGTPRPAVFGSVWKMTEARREELVLFPGTWITGLQSTEKGALVSLNNGGRLYHVLSDGTFEMREELKAGQVSGFLRGGSGVLLGGRGGVAWLNSTPSTQGTYTSAVFDSEYVSEWGHFDLRGKGKVSVRVRSGLTQRPADGWSRWSNPMTTFPSKIASPKGRYVQFQIQFGDAQGEVAEVRFSYRHENQPPRLSNVKVESLASFPPPEPPLPGSDPGQRAHPIHSSIKQISWQGADPNGDELAYSVWYRAEGSKTWLPAFENQPQLASIVKWNTDSIADGRYVIKIVASDERANSGGEKLTAEIESDPVPIDNSKPRLRARYADGRLIGNVTDSMSRIVKLEVQIDGGPWRSFPSKDGVFDSRSEEFDLSLAFEGATLVVRATDSEMNCVLERVELKK